MTPTDTITDAEPVRLAVIGVGWMGRFHAETVAQRLAGARLECVVDADLDTAQALATELHAAKAGTDASAVFADPAVDGVIIATPPRFHSALMQQAAAAGKAIFCEKPASMTLEELDAAIDAVAVAGVPLQIGFNRRFSRDFVAAHKELASGAIGVPQLMRSLTRDPAPLNPATIKPFAIFLETLIHDFDILNWFNTGASAVEVNAWADALIRPDFKEAGLLDTAVVSIRYDNGALATAEASLEVNYGYDVRGEVLGSAGMVMAGDVHQTRSWSYGRYGVRGRTARLNLELFHDAYVAELELFVANLRRWRSGVDGDERAPGGSDARAALAMSLAAIESFQIGGPVRLAP